MKIYQFEKSADTAPLRALIKEYIVWVRDNLNTEYSIYFPDDIIDSAIENDLANIDKFLPPIGCLLVAEIDNELAGIVCLKPLDEGIAEVKRMYVRPQFRRLGIAQKLMQKLIDDAKAMNYSLIRLETSHFMKNAHPLYRSFGFKEIEAYEGGESSPELKDLTIFMELSLGTAD